MELRIDSKITLNNGVKIPNLGLGVYLSGKGRETVDAVNRALSCGYRHIDTASMYGNEDDVGKGVSESDIKREDVFITTKLWNSDHGYDRTLKAFDASLELLGLDYVDLYLIHWPVAKLRIDSWKALEAIYEDGRAKSIGVSNYTVKHLKELLGHCEIKLVVNQVEYHPFLYQKGLQDFCEANEILIEAYSPLTKGFKLNEPLIKKIGAEHSKSPAQVMIRWVLQKGIVVLPKSANKDRIKENREVYDFSISDDEMAALDALNQNWHCTWDPTDAP